MIIEKAPPALPLTLTSAVPAFFMDAAVNSKSPCMLTLPNSAGLDLKLLNVNVTGLIQPNQPGNIQIGLYCYVNGPKVQPPPPPMPSTWLTVGLTAEEDIGGPTDHSQSQFMFQAANLMFNFSSGKLQGVYYNNIASNPEGPDDLDDDILGLMPISPIVWFAVGAIFTPTADTGAKAELTLATFTLTGDF
jgi:hypothetical protein